MAAYHYGGTAHSILGRTGVLRSIGTLLWNRSLRNLRNLRMKFAILW
jgi:hypothetical protein